MPIVTPVYCTSTNIVTSSIPYVTPCTGKPYLPLPPQEKKTQIADFFQTRNHHIRHNSPFGLREPLPGDRVYNFVLHHHRCYFDPLSHDDHYDQAEHIHDFFDQHEHEVCYFFGG